MSKHLVDLEYLREISDNNQEFIQEMIRSFIDHAPWYLEEMKQAYNLQDWDLVDLTPTN